MARVKKISPRARPRPSKKKDVEIPQDVKDALEGSLDPMLLMEGLANGKDLTKRNTLYTYAMQQGLDEEVLPDEEQWRFIYNLIQAHYKYALVRTPDVLSAAKTLSEYRHVKKKNNAQVSTDDDGEYTSGSSIHTPLTEDEIDTFMKKLKGYDLI